MTKANRDDLPFGIVVIGRNESERLRACLNSIECDRRHIVYVDSGSSDDSLAIARALDVDAVSLDMSRGPTAARARNAGFRRLLEISPDSELVLFVDGDCTITSGWLTSAAEFMRAHAEVAVVSGRRRERDPDRNLYHRLADMEWNSLPGEATQCGGDAMMRAAALRAVGGYRETLIAGEEPDLCFRLRKAGWKVWRLERDMTLHDIRMTRFGQWWRRAVRAGHAYTEGLALHCSLHERYRLKKVCSIWFWALLPFIAGLLSGPSRGLSLIALLAAFLLLIVKITRHRVSTYHDSVRNALLYAVACVIANWPQAVGSLKYAWGRLTGAHSRLIEYQADSARPVELARPTVE